MSISDKIESGLKARKDKTHERKNSH